MHMCADRRSTCLSSENSFGYVTISLLSGFLKRERNQYKNFKGTFLVVECSLGTCEGLGLIAKRGGDWKGNKVRGSRAQASSPQPLGNRQALYDQGQGQRGQPEGPASHNRRVLERPRQHLICCLGPPGSSHNLFKSLQKSTQKADEIHKAPQPGTCQR